MIIWEVRFNNKSLLRPELFEVTYGGIAFIAFVEINNILYRWLGCTGLVGFVFAFFALSFVSFVGVMFAFFRF